MGAQVKGMQVILACGMRLHLPLKATLVIDKTGIP